MNEDKHCSSSLVESLSRGQMITDESWVRSRKEDLTVDGNQMPEVRTRVQS